MKLEKNHCAKCGHRWWSKNPTKTPVQCPACKSYQWQKKEKARTVLV